MRMLISAVGTRGDVQPAVALAMQVRDLGHEVRMCVPPNFAGWAARLGFEARPMGVEMRAPRPGEAQAHVPDLIADQFDVLGSAAVGCDLIVGGGLHQYAAPSIAQVRGVPFVASAYAPVSLPSPELGPSGQASGGPTEILRLWDEERRRWNARALERVNANRAGLGLASIDDVLDHLLTRRPWLAADPTLGPAPPTPDLEVVQAGAWVLPDTRPLSPDLEAFLEAGDPPVYLGLGSMPAAPDAGRRLVEAARAVGRRAILSRGWAELSLPDDAPDCFLVDEANHHLLFGRVGAVVHHGGAGTTVAAARAGAPQVVVPMFADQFYWGRRIAALGVGLVAGLTTEALASALDAAMGPVVADRARSMAREVVADGAAVAARRVTQYA